VYEKLFYPIGKLVVVTGGAGQLGSELCRILDGLGNDVVMADVDAEVCKRKIEEFKLKRTIPMKLDITKQGSIDNFFKKLVARYGKIDSLINNAGISTFTQFESRTYEDFDKVMKVNVYGTFFCSKAALAIMEKQGFGNIINIGSIYGVVSPDPAIYGDSGRNSPEVYGASKAGIIQITKYLACHVKCKKIRINAVSPGGIFNNQKKFFVDNYERKTPCGKMACADEVASATVFLLSDAAKYINGHNLMVDGGFSVW
jgi:NAD(P)-dependent dehydrogenase (short-subunit alcohol dehydrogenase family)